jgi:hypothetical protein
MHIFKPNVENVLGDNTTPTADQQWPLSLTTVRYTEQDYQILVNQVKKSSLKAAPNGSQDTVAKNGKVDLVDIASWILGRTPISDLQPINLFTGQPLPTSSSYVDPCTIPFVNFTQLSEPSVHHSDGLFTTTHKPLTLSFENPDGLNSTSRHATPSTSLMVTDGAVPDNHYDVTSSSTAHSLVTSTDNPSPTAPRTTSDIADLVSTPPSSVIHNNYGNPPAELVEEEMEDVIGEILDEEPHFVTQVSQTPTRQSVNSTVINNEYTLGTKETPSWPGDGKATTEVFDKLKDLGDMVQSISEDREHDIPGIATRMDVDKLPQPVNSSEPTDDIVMQETLHTVIPSDKATVKEPKNSTVHIEQDKKEKVAGTTVLIDHDKLQETSDSRLLICQSDLQVVAKVPADTAMSANANKAQECTVNEAHNSQQQMDFDERIHESKQHDSATTSQTIIEQRTFESTPPVENAIHQQASSDNNPTKSIDFDTSVNHPVMVDDDSINERLSSVEYTLGTEKATELTIESTKWVYCSTDIEVLEPAILNEHKSLEKVNLVYPHHTTKLCPMLNSTYFRKMDIYTQNKYALTLIT